MKKIHKILSMVLVLFLLGWGMSSLAEDDISSAHSNFSVIGIISDISEDAININQAQGSDKSGKVSYTLDISHLNRVETETYVQMQKADLKNGNKIIAQGLTNGSTFFIKRIVSFSYVPSEDNASSTLEDMIAASSTFDGVVIASSTPEDSISTTTDSTPVLTEDSIDNATSNATTTTDNNVATSTDTNSTSTDELISTTTATSTDTSSTTEDVSTTTSTSTESVVDKVVDTVQDVVDAVTETVTDIVDVIIETVSGNDNEETSTGVSSEPAPTATPTSTENTEGSQI